MFPIKTHKELEGLDNALENQNIGLARVYARRAMPIPLSIGIF
jgi:hypothetical protein